MAVSFLGLRLGRKAPLVWSYLQLAVSGAATAYVSSFSAYCVFRFLMGMTFSGIILNSLSLGKARCQPHPQGWLGLSGATSAHDLPPRFWA